MSAGFTALLHLFIVHDWGRAIADFYLKQGDTTSVLNRTLRDADGNVVDVTGATIVFSMMNSAGTVKVNLQSASIVTAAQGAVRYTWASADVDTVGTYRGEFKVTYSGGGIQRFPNDSYIVIEITDNVA